MRDYYGNCLLFDKIWEFLEKEHSASDIIKKTKIPQATVYRILGSLVRYNRVITKNIKIKNNRDLKLYKIKTKRIKKANQKRKTVRKTK